MELRIFQCIFLALAAGIDLLFTGFPIVLPIYAALTSIPSVLLFIRRLHDCGYSGWWVFPAIVPPICFFVMCWAPDPAQPNKYGTTERLPSKNLRAKTVPPLIDGIEYLTPPPMPFEPAVKRREELFEKEQKEIIEQEKVPNSKETQNEKDIRQTGQKIEKRILAVVADLKKAKRPVRSNTSKWLRSSWPT